MPLQPLEVHGGADLHLQPMEETHAGAGGCLKEAVTPWEAHAGAGSWQDLWPCGESGGPTGAGFLAGVVTPRGTHTGEV